MWKVNGVRSGILGLEEKMSSFGKDLDALNKNFAFIEKKIESHFEN